MAMDENSTREWTKIRMHPDVKKLGEQLLARAGGPMSLTDFFNALLGESLKQIDSDSDDLQPVPTVLMLRAKLGKRSLRQADSDFDARLAAIEDQLRALSARESDHPSNTLRVAEPPPARRAPKPRRTSKS